MLFIIQKFTATKRISSEAYPTRRNQKKKNNSSNFTQKKNFKIQAPNAGSTIRVCRIMFLNTLGISEKTLRTALAKLNEEGVIVPDKRGGRNKELKEQDKKLRDSAFEHIQKFPRKGSQFCRKSSSKEYLHSDLTIKKMYHLYKDEEARKESMCSYQTYRRVFRFLNLSFHHPKKGQCILCMSFRLGDAEKKKALENAFSIHTAEKNAVRQKKEKVKELSKTYPNLLASAVFDLQQVIQLPISNESAIFYRRR